MAEQKKGQIQIFAKNIKGNARGGILEESKFTRNIAGGRHIQNGGNGVNNDVNQPRKESLRVVKVEGPFDPTTNRKVDIIEKGKKYNFKVTQYNRLPNKEELKNLKWGFQYDNGIISHALQVNGLTEISYFISKERIDVSKLKVYAFFRSPSNNVKVETNIKNLEPLIIYICGYWNTSMPYAGTEWGERYWGSKLKSSAKAYFGAKKEYFINGAGTKFSSGNSRFNQGKQFAEARLQNNQSKFFNEVFKERRKIMIVSHSMGAAFAEGVISVMKKQNVIIEKVVHLSPADTSGFSVNLPNISYQIDIDWDPVLMYKNANDATKIRNIKFAGIVKNPRNDEFGHMYTKEEDFVWKWFEDLENIRFNFIRSEKKYNRLPSDGLGPAMTQSYTEKIYRAVGQRNDTQFIRVIKDNIAYHHHAQNEYENYEF